MRALEDMKEILEDQIKKINKKGDAITPQELDNAYKAVDIIKDIETIDAMQKAAKEQEMEKEQGNSMAMGGGSRGYSGNSMWMPYYAFDNSMNSMAGRGGGYQGGGSQAGGNSNRGGSYESYDGGGQSSRDSYGNSNEGQSNEYSERRGRNQRTGRYMSRDGSYEGSYGYSGHEEKEQLKREIQEMQKKLEQM